VGSTSTLYPTHSNSTFGCRSDATVSEEILGTWTWNPREHLPPEKIQDTGFTTPTLEAFEFSPGGRYVHIERIEIAELTRGKLRLATRAIGDHERVLQRARALPQRPSLAPARR
jgi:hypothetical protein